LRFQRIALKNYRQFRDAGLCFNEPYKGYDIHIIVGRNGTGKTNLLNAINWCFYGDEPHLSSKSGQLPRFNLAEESTGNKGEVCVKVEMLENSGREIAFSRRNHGALDELEVFIKTIAGYEHYGEEVFERNVHRIAPKTVRSFFFFDGEHLDTYFKRFQSIKDQIESLSRVNILDIMEERLSQLIKELGSSAKNLDPEIKDVINRKQTLEEKVKEIEERSGEKQKGKEDIEEEIEKIEDYLRDLPDAEKYQKRMDQLKVKEQKLLERRNEILQQKRQKLIQLAKITYLWEALDKLMEIMKEKREQKELPPQISDSLLEEILESGVCSICGQELSFESKNSVKELLQKIELSSRQGNKLLVLEMNALNIKKNAKDLYNRIKEITNELTKIEEELREISKEEREIDDVLRQHNSEEIRLNQKRLNEMKNKRDDFIREIEHYEMSKKAILKNIDNLKREYDELKKLQDKNDRGFQMYEMFSQSKEIVSIVKKEIMAEIREHIERATNEIFFKLIWKKESFEKVIIRDNYTVEVLNVFGKNCIGSLSAAERELLALSFTLALHQISGFDAPLVIDTPLARVSDEHRRNFAKSLLEVSKNKQIALLLTPAEFSEEVEQELHPHIASLHKLEMLPDETETIIKEESPIPYV